jgi:hypothetical protein
MSRKQRIDSSTAAVRVMAAALSELEPPAHSPLPEAAMPFWRSIIRGRTRDEWEATPALMVTASSLAWTQWQSVKIRGEIELAAEVDAKSVKRLDDLNRLEMAYLRTLQQHGRGAEGEARDVSKRRSMAGAIAKGAQVAEEDDLIARPTVN